MSVEKGPQIKIVEIGDVRLVEVEKVVTSLGEFSIYQAIGKQTEDIEDAVAMLRECGKMIGEPNVFGHVAEPYFQHGNISFKDRPDLETVIFLAGPVAEELSNIP